jgi:hypothetical protein
MPVQRAGKTDAALPADRSIPEAGLTSRTYRDLNGAERAGPLTSLSRQSTTSPDQGCSFFLNCLISAGTISNRSPAMP